MVARSACHLVHRGVEVVRIVTLNVEVVNHYIHLCRSSSHQEISYGTADVFHGFSHQRGQSSKVVFSLHISSSLYISWFYVCTRGVDV